MTLTFKLGLDMNQVDLHVKFHVHTSNGSAMRVLHYSHTHTDRTDSITSTADAGGNNLTFLEIEKCRLEYGAFKFYRPEMTAWEAMKSLLAFQFIGVPEAASQTNSDRVRRETNTADTYNNGQLVNTSFYGPVRV